MATVSFVMLVKADSKCGPPLEKGHGFLPLGHRVLGRDEGGIKLPGAGSH